MFIVGVELMAPILCRLAIDVNFFALGRSPALPVCLPQAAFGARARRHRAAIPGTRPAAPVIEPTRPPATIAAMRTTGRRP
jgi:hypothetical protein